MIALILNSWICWSIFIAALACYYLLCHDLLQVKMQCQPVQGHWHEVSVILVAALPLLGLLGTVMGLLATFSEMSNGSVGGELLSGGVADALITTQLGLVFAIPAWLLQCYVESQSKQLLAQQSVSSSDAALA